MTAAARRSRADFVASDSTRAAAGDESSLASSQCVCQDAEYPGDQQPVQEDADIDRQLRIGNHSAAVERAEYGSRKDETEERSGHCEDDVFNDELADQGAARG